MLALKIFKQCIKRRLCEHSHAKLANKPTWNKKRYLQGLLWTEAFS